MQLIETETKYWRIHSCEVVPYPSGAPRYCHTFLASSAFAEPLSIPWAVNYSTSNTFGHSFVYLLKHSGWSQWA